MGKRLLPWATGYCRVPKVPWPCAKGTGIAVDRGLLPWAEGFCMGRGLLLGAGELLPWAKGYCRIHVLYILYTGKQRAGAVSKGLLPRTKTETPP